MQREALALNKKITSCDDVDPKAFLFYSSLKLAPKEKAK